MRAIIATRAGGPDVLKLTTLPDPEPGPDQLLVEVAAAGINFIDTYRRSGTYPMDFPHVVGSEGAGIIRATGGSITDPALAPGKAVAWANAPGSYASLALVPATAAIPVPDDIPLTTAAALPLQGMTAHYLTHSTYPVRQDDDILIHAGAGGVGLLATQLAAARGARVITTVSTDDKAHLSRQAGATDVIRYDRLDDLTTELPERIRELTDGKGVEAAYDGVGRTTFDASLAALAIRGTLILFGGSSGQVPPVDLQRLNTAGSVYVTRPTLAHYTRTPDELRTRAQDLFDAVRTGRLDIRIGATYPLEGAAEAHTALENRRTTGKLLLSPNR